MKRIRFYKPTRLRCRWVAQPYHWWGYCEDAMEASKFNMTYSMLSAAKPKLLRWLPTIVAEKNCKVCGKIFFSGWENHSNICAKWSCFQKYSTVNLHADGKNTEEGRLCISKEANKQSQ